jgi:hypothetical protein
MLCTIVQIFATFGTTSAENATILFALIPALWLSKLRQLRLLSKLGMNLLLPVLPRVDALLPLFPAPLQVSMYRAWLCTVCPCAHVLGGACR